MKKASSKSIVTGIGVAMAIGSAATLIGSSMMTDKTMTSMKKSAEKAIKNFGSYLGSM